MKPSLLKVLIASVACFVITDVSMAASQPGLTYLIGTFVYLIAGVFLPVVRTDAKLSLILFAPFAIMFIIAFSPMNGNPALMPTIIPVLPILCYAAFVTGSYISLFIATGQFVRAGSIVAGLTLALSLTIFIILPTSQRLSNRIGEIMEQKRTHIETEKVRTALNHIFKNAGNCYNFGTIGIQQTVAYKYQIFNPKEQPLEIKNVKASCDCVVSEYTTTPVQQGQFAMVSVVFKPKQSGAVLNNIVVETNDAANPFMSFQLTGEVN